MQQQPQDIDGADGAGAPLTSGIGRGRRDRVAGALLGVHAGDALGATFEFQSWQAIRARHPEGLREIVGGGPFGWPPGHATDDTDLTRAVLLAHLNPGPGGDVVATAAAHMLDWLEGRWPGRTLGRAPVDVGGATRRGLERYRDTRDPRRAGAGEGAAGNGSLMRCLPTALAVADRRTRIRTTLEISAITHDDRRCTVACAAYNELVVALLDGAAPSAAVDAGTATARELGVDEVAEAVLLGSRLRLAAVVATGPLPLADEAAGFVLDSLSLAVAALVDARPLAAVLVDVVRVGNDTDTNAAIAGGLLGARDGVRAIPEPWLATLQFRDEFAAAAQVLSARSVPRP